MTSIKMKLWKGRFQKEADPKTNDFNSSISVDSRMVKEDIEGSIAHATMLGACGIIAQSESDKICAELKKIAADIESGALHIDPDAEDIHTFIEGELTARIGDAGKRLHTARSRNDQVALDVRLTLRKECAGLIGQLKELISVLCDQAEEYADAVMPGYTHLQRAQPITFGHHLMAYAEMFLRDIGRMQDAVKRMDVCPLGSGALAGTTYPLDRDLTAKLLGFTAVSRNSLDGVADRDFCAEIAAAVSLAMVHLSRFSEEVILSALLTMMKGLPLAYNKDMQEDKEAVFDAVDTLRLCLTPFIPMLKTMRVLKENMRSAAAKGFINATDCADYLVAAKGLPFRDAYKITGELVALCIERGLTLEMLPLTEYKKVCESFDEGVYEAINLEKCVNDRRVKGGPCPENVRAAAKEVRALLA